MDQKEKIMENTTDQIKIAFDAYLLENTKFENGNASAGTRARKALGDMSKLIKARRNEITTEKNARKAAK